MDETAGFGKAFKNLTENEIIFLKEYLQDFGFVNSDLEFWPMSTNELLNQINLALVTLNEEEKYTREEDSYRESDSDYMDGEIVLYEEFRHDRNMLERIRSKLRD